MSETTTVAVIDRKGERHEYDAGGWHEEAGHLFVTKDGENVAVFAPGQGKVVSAPDEAGGVAVLDQAGNGHVFDADDWDVTETGFVHVLKDGKRVASFPPGHVGVFRHGARLGSA